MRYILAPALNCLNREDPSVTYVIAEPCVDLLDKSCMEECPVDCIYEGGRMLYIHPDECVDCGACEPVCPVTTCSSRSSHPCWRTFRRSTPTRSVISWWGAACPAASRASTWPGGSSVPDRVSAPRGALRPLNVPDQIAGQRGLQLAGDHAFNALPMSPDQG